VSVASRGIAAIAAVALVACGGRFAAVDEGPGDRPFDAGAATGHTGEESAPDANETSVGDVTDASLGTSGDVVTPEAPDATGEAASPPCGDTSYDAHNCGACGHDCLGGTCSAGACLPAMIFTEGDGDPFGIAIDAHYAYVTDDYNDAVWKVPLDGSTTTLLASSNHPSDIVIDASRAYWVGGDGLSAVPLVGGSSAILASGPWEAYGVAVDATSVYLAVFAQQASDGSPIGQILSLPLVGGGATPRSLASGLNVPISLQRGPTGLEWLDLNSSYPFSSPVLMQLPVDGADGGAPTTVALEGADAGDSPGTGAVALDATNVYWSELDELLKMPLAGGPPQLLASVGPASGLAVDATGVYAACSSRIVRVPLEGGAPVVLAQGLFNARRLAVDATRIYWTDADEVMALAK
jgi:hypothetical protein